MPGLTTVMDDIVILDDIEEPSSSILVPQTPSRVSFLPRVPQPKATHITESPFGSAKKEGHVLKVENEKLFTEFVEHCTAHTQEHPEVMTFLQAKYSKVSPSFLMSVEFRNALGRCLTRAQANTAKTFVYIGELCTMLKKHSNKKKVTESSSSKKQDGDKNDGTEDKGKNEVGEPSTSGQADVMEKKKVKKASKRQIAYLENLLMVYNEEIKRLQERDLGLDDLDNEDSSYIQEHKLKRKMMKIYEKLCELKDCSTLTGRVVEQRIRYSGSRFPEINKKIERFINKPEAQQNPPDYTDILHVVKCTNDRYQLLLSRKQQVQIAQEAFSETGNKLQERRHLDMVYNFGSHLTDAYKPTLDPALRDPSLTQKLRSNREVAMTTLEEVIKKYAKKQDDTEEEERRKRMVKDKLKKENEQHEQKEKELNKSEEEQEEPEDEQDQEEEKEEDEEEDEEEEDSSEPDIDEELQASAAQEGPDDEDNDEEETNNHDAESLQMIEEDAGEEEEEEEEEVPEAHAIESPSSTEDHKQPTVTEDVHSDSNCHQSCDRIIINQSDSTSGRSEPTTLTASAYCSPLEPSSEVTEVMEVTRLSDVTVNSRKRKLRSHGNHITVQNSDVTNSASEPDIPLDMGVICVGADSTQADLSPKGRSPCTPPPKKNKVNVATQCDPEEVIVLSDSE